jgi:hypothetical protein
LKTGGVPAGFYVAFFGLAQCEFLTGNPITSATEHIYFAALPDFG